MVTLCKYVQNYTKMLISALIAKHYSVHVLSQGALELDIGSTKQKNAELEQLKQQLEHQV